MDVSIEKTVAEAPFNDPKADFILISSDGILFYVHRILLAIASPVFETMLSLPPDNSQEKYDGRPCVTFEDEAKNLRLLLSWCYKHHADGRPTSLDDLQSILELTDKYSMHQITAQVEDTILKTLQDVVAANPLRLFCIAVRFRLLALARAAAIETLNVPVLEWWEIPEMERMPASMLIRLIKYRKARVHAVQVPVDAHLKNLTRIRRDGFGSMMGRHISHNYKDGCTGVGWCEDYLKRVKQALETCSSVTTLNSTFLQESVTKIKSLPCGTCRIDAPSDLIAIHQSLIEELEVEYKIGQKVEPAFGF